MAAPQAAHADPLAADPSPGPAATPAAAPGPAAAAEQQWR
eukprot:gene5360-2149_t